VTLRRTTGTQLIPFDVPLRAVVRDYLAQELVGPIIQGDRRVILSPTEVSLRQFPWPPQPGDKILLQLADDERQRPYNIEAAEVIRMNGVPVRFNLRVRG
jgi:hypothetical protein